MAGYADFGNGNGLLYVTEADGTTLSASILNDVNGAKIVLQNALTVAPESGEVLSVGTVTVNVGGGTVTTCTVNGVDVMGATAASGVTPALIAADLAAKINAQASTPEYTAIVGGTSANVVYIFAVVGTGSAPNGFVVTAGVTAPTTVTTANMDGGRDGTGIFDTIMGRRYFINSAISAVEGVLAGSTEITKNIVKRGIESQLYTQNIVISNGIITPVRVGAISVVNVDTEGLAATDNLDTISVGSDFQNNDILIIRGTNSARDITVKHNTGNIFLTNNTDYTTDALQNQLILQYQTPVGGTIGWRELTRSATLPNVAALRAQGIPQPISGVNLTTLTAGGGTIDIEAGVDKGTQVYDGSATLVASWVIQPKAVPTTPYLDGDEIWTIYNSTLTTGANTVTIFGIALTTQQALEGAVTIRAKYRLADTTWYSDIIYSNPKVTRTFAVFGDITTSVPDFVGQLSTLLASGGGFPAGTVYRATGIAAGNWAVADFLPASGGAGFVLSTTSITPNVYSFVPIFSTGELSFDGATTGTPASTAETILKTYTLVAGTLGINGDSLYMVAHGQVAANANIKTIRFRIGGIGGSEITSHTAFITAPNGLVWHIEGTLTRTAAAECRAVFTFYFTNATTGAVLGNSFDNTIVVDFTTDLVIVVTGQNGVATLNDILSTSLLINKVAKQS